MKTLLSTLFFSLYFLTSLNSNELIHPTTPLLIVNSITITQTLPKRFRRTDTLFQKALNSSGLNLLRASASAQYSVQEFLALVNHFKEEELIIIDLRKEPHGFLNQFAVSWYTPKNWLNKPLSLQNSILNEQERLSYLKKSKKVILHKILEKSYGASYITAIKLPISPSHVASEEEICFELNTPYNRFSVTDHVKPSDEVIDSFVELVKNRSSKSWFHFHCNAGRGRATTFLTLLDILYNGTTLSLKTIANRQHALGGIDLLDLPSLTVWKYPNAVERRQFIIDFYLYVKDQSPHFSLSWSSWMSRRTKTPQDTPL